MITPHHTVFLLITLLIATANDAQGQIRAEAYYGEPMGVGRITVNFPPGNSSPLTDDRLTIGDATGRVLYPAASERRVRQVLRQFLRVDLPRRTTFYFLFTGTEPLDIDVYTPTRQTIRITPRHDREDHHELLAEWWEAYVELYRRVHNEAEYPLEVQTYLTAMWAERLGTSMPQLEGALLRQQDQGGTVTGKLLADEAYRASLLRDLMLGRLADDQQQVLLPEHAIPVGSLPMPSEEVAIESLASHVPEECFYVRFGSFQNYLWFRDFTSRWQGDLGNMLVLRNIRRDTGARISEQIALAETDLARILGPQVISDVAIVGTDPYFRHGASMGMLFEAKNNFLLGRDFRNKRAAALKENPDATLEEVTIAGQTVSYLSTPDGRIRSYYAVVGNYHFVTTSATLVERFYAAGEGERPLAATPDFLAARQRVPFDDPTTVFVHLSKPFLEHLTSPPYRIELDRRLRSMQSLHAIHLAQLAANQEGQPGETIEQLIQGQFLPVQFLSRADGATWQQDNDQRWRESLRGLRGQFLPIADNLPTNCSPQERDRYNEFASNLRSEIGGLVPLTATIFREPGSAEGRDFIHIDVQLAPYSATNLASWAKRLGPAAEQRLAPIAGDVVAGEVTLDDLAVGGGPVHLFGGIRDGHVPLAISGGMLTTATSLPEAIQGYVGAWPKPDLLERWLGRARGPADAEGFGRTGGLFDLWTHRADDFLLISFKRQVLAEVGPQLAMVESAIPAQAHFYLADLVGTQYQPIARAYGYARTRQTSASGSRFMNSLIEQLHVDKQQALLLANELAGGEWVCPLGGEYVLVEIPGGVQAWASTAAAPNNQFSLTEIPPDYHFPLLEWFRGMTASVLRGDDDSLHLMLTFDVSEAIPAEAPAEGAGPQPEVEGTSPPPIPSRPSGPPVEELPRPPQEPR